MNQQSAPEHKPPTYRLPEVPAYRYRKFSGVFYRALYTFICLAVVLVIVWGGFRGTTAVVAFVSPKPAKTVFPTPTPTMPPLPVHLTTQETTLLENSCPDTGLLVLPSPPALTQPTLDFCSPKYYSNVTGPLGSHITLIGTDIPTQPAEWAVVNHVEARRLTSVKDLQTCIQPKGGCFLLPPPKIDAHLPIFSLYSWTWQSPKFPTNAGDNYDIVAFSPTSAQLLWSSISFTLNSALAPCISVVTNTANSGDCTKKGKIALAPGTTVTINGKNWILQYFASQQPTQPIPLTIQINISCKPPTTTKCTPGTLPNLSTKIGLDGSFTLSFTVPQASGVYIVTASCQIPVDQQIATPGLSPTSDKNTNTIVNGALTFGDADDATGLTLDIGTNQLP
jgi:hypothetical protein